MPETPEQFWERTHDNLQAPPVAEWDTWPFEGPVQPKLLAPPVEREKPRSGEGGVDCHACEAPDDAYAWTSERWRLRALDKPSLPMPIVVAAFDALAAAPASRFATFSASLAIAALPACTSTARRAFTSLVWASASASADSAAAS